MLTILEIIRRAEEYLAQRGVARARREAEEVVAAALNLKRLELYLQFDRPVLEEELVQLRALLLRRGAREPLPYITAKIEFGGRWFTLTPSVLIPRQETEILVEKIAAYLKGQDLENKVLWDVCCGSGCIGLSIKKRFPRLSVVLSDLKAEALEVARINGGDEVSYVRGNLFEPFKNQKCDFFVCNPPYIAESEFSQLDPEVRDWEPKAALVSGPSGLEFYQTIACELGNYLHQGGRGWLEIGSGQGAAVHNLFQLQGFNCRFEQDWSGHDRFFFIE